MPGKVMAVPHCALGNAESAVHGRPNMDPARPDVEKEQEPRPFALHSQSAGSQPGMA